MRLISFSFLVVTAGLTSGNQDESWIIRKGSSSAYLMNFGENSWMFAREKCLAHGADLISINSREELDWAAARYTRNRIRENYLYVGLTEKTNYKTWVDGTQLNATLLKWRTGEPLKNIPMYNCAVFDVDKKEFFVTSCDIPAIEIWKIRYICEKHMAVANSTEPFDKKTEIHSIRPESLADPFAWLSFLNGIGRSKDF